MLGASSACPLPAAQTVRATYYEQESSGGLGAGERGAQGRTIPLCFPQALRFALCPVPLLPLPRPTPNPLPVLCHSLAAGKVPRYSFVHSFGRLAREQGLLALWRGNTPYLLRHVPSISMSFAFKVRAGGFFCASLFWGRDRPAWQRGGPARRADLQSN